MKSIDELVRLRLDDWQELELLAQSAGGRELKTLRPFAIDRLGNLYRQTLSDLAMARRDYPDDRVTRYLEGLAARTHPVIFRARPQGLRILWHGLFSAFPKSVRAIQGSVILSSLAFFGTGLIAYLVAIGAPERIEMFLPSGMVSRVNEVGEAVRNSGVSPWVEIPETQRPFESYLLALNNIQVALLAFAGGAALGLFTLHVLVTNGFVLGGIAGLCHREQALVPLGTFVSAHGFIELSVIVLAGAAGLSIGRAWIQPGELPRFQAVTLTARKAVTVALGGSAWLLIAAGIEGMISPSDLPPLAKLSIGLASGTLLWTSILLGGRSGQVPIKESTNSETMLGVSAQTLSR